MLSIIYTHVTHTYIYIYAWLRWIRISIWCLIKGLATGFTLWHVVSQHSSAILSHFHHYGILDSIHGQTGTWYKCIYRKWGRRNPFFGQQKEEFHGPVALDGLCATPFGPFRFTQFHHVSLFFQWPEATSCSYSSRSHFPTWIWWMTKSCTCIMSQPSVFVWGLKFNLLDQQLGAFPPWLVCCIFTQQSRVWTRTWGRIQTGHHCNPKTVACKNDATQRWADLAKQAQ